jgi:hypothetical protein
MPYSYSKVTLLRSSEVLWILVSINITSLWDWAKSYIRPEPQALTNSTKNFELRLPPPGKREQPRLLFAHSLIESL